MAIRQRGGSFQVYWRNPFTKKQESVSCKSMEEAQKTDDQMSYRLRWDTESFRPTEKTKEVVTDTLGGIIYAYLEDRKLDEHGVRNVLYGVREAVKKWDKTPISHITRQNLETLLADLLKRHQPGTARVKMVRLRTVFLWAHRHELLKEVPVWPELPPIKYEHFIPPTQEEMQRIIAVAPEYVRRIVLIGSQLGVRVGPSELYKMEWADFDLENNVCHVRAAKKNKNEPVRDVPIKPSFTQILKAWKADDEAKGNTGIIIRTSTGGRLIKLCAWRDVLKKAGITRRIRPYDLRHAFATELMARGIDVGTVAKLMGHADATMVLKHYQHVTNAQKKAAISALPDTLLEEACMSVCMSNPVCQNRMYSPEIVQIIDLIQ